VPRQTPVDRAARIPLGKSFPLRIQLHNVLVMKIESVAPVLLIWLTHINQVH
jgi:hypothetical protein